MDYVKLPSPGLVNRAFDLRKDAARAISHVETAARNGAGGVASAQALRSFFLACANACDVAAGGTGRVALVPATVPLNTSTGVVSTGSATRNSPATLTVAGGVVTLATASA